MLHLLQRRMLERTKDFFHLCDVSTCTAEYASADTPRLLCIIEACFLLHALSFQYSGSCVAVGLQVLGVGAASACLEKRDRALDLCHSGSALVRGLDGRPFAQAPGAGRLLGCSLPRGLHPPAPFHAGRPQAPLESGPWKSGQCGGRSEAPAAGREQQRRVGLRLAHGHFYRSFHLQSVSFFSAGCHDHQSWKEEEECMGGARSRR